MRDVHRFLLALFVSALFTLPYSRELVHSYVLSWAYLPFVRLEAQALDLIRLRGERDYLLGEASKLARALGFKRFKRLGAGAGARPLRYEPLGVPERIVLDWGRAQGVRRGDAVMAGGALVGVITQVELGTSVCMSVFNPSFRVGVVDTRSGVLGVYRGGSRGSLEMVPAWEDVREGDTLVTSGLGGAFPPGVPVAVVEAVFRTHGAFLKASLRPLYRFSKLQTYAVVR